MIVLAVYGTKMTVHLPFVMHVIKCETNITFVIPLFGGLEYNLVAGFQGHLRKKRLSAVTFICVLVKNLPSELQKSHSSVVIVLTDYCLIIQNKESGTNILYLWIM